jgi:hypothetical protein
MDTISNVFKHSYLIKTIAVVQLLFNASEMFPGMLDSFLCIIVVRI